MIYHLEKIDEIILTTLWTAGVRSGIPLSLMIVGEPGICKSKLIIRYQGPGIRRSDDLTSCGVMDILASDKDNQLHHLIIPDLNAVLSHKSSTTGLTFSNMLSMTSEGVARIDDGRRTKEVPHHPVGIITAVTRKMYELNYERWEIIGLRRRFLTIFFDYSTLTVQTIQANIADGKITLAQEAPIPVTIKPFDCGWREQEKLTVISLADKLASNLSVHPVMTWSRQGRKPKTVASPTANPITPHLMLKQIAEAHTRINKGVVVGQAQINFLAHLIDFTRYDRPVRL